MRISVVADLVARARHRPGGVRDPLGIRPALKERGARVDYNNILMKCNRIDVNIHIIDLHSNFDFNLYSLG